MPWSNQGGGGSGGGPWGQRPGGGAQPPNLEEVLRRGQERVRRFIPGGFGTGRGVLLIGIFVILIWLLTGLYRVQPDEQGVELLFGRWNQATTTPGLHYWFPVPIGQTITPKVERINRVDVGFRAAAGTSGRSQAAARDVPRESLMLTGDQNIADVDFTVLWRIRDAGEFLFNIRDQEETVKIVAESAIREVVGQLPFEDLLTRGRTQVEQDTRVLLQEILDGYNAGILIQNVQLLEVDPPQQVIDAFNEVQRARQDKERLQNQAEAYRNRIVPTARGEAASIVEQAEAYKERVTKEADGVAQEFISVYESYKEAKEVTRRRMYLETLEEVMGKANKVIIDSAEGGGTQGVVPYLPLNELARPRAAAAQQGGQ